MISFKGSRFTKDIILHAMYLCLRFGVSHHDLEETLAKRGIVVDHATLNRWVMKFPALAAITAAAHDCFVASTMLNKVRQADFTAA